MFGNNNPGVTPGGYPIPNIPIRTAVQPYVADLIDLVMGVANQNQNKNAIRNAFWQALGQNGGNNQVYIGLINMSLICFEYLCKAEGRQPRDAANFTADKMNAFWSVGVLKNLPQLQNQLPQNALQAASQTYDEYQRVANTLDQFVRQYPDNAGGFGGGGGNGGGFVGGVRVAGGFGGGNMGGGSNVGGFTQLPPVNAGLPGTGIKPMTPLPNAGGGQSVFSNTRTESILDVAVGNTYTKQLEERRQLHEQHQQQQQNRSVSGSSFTADAFSLNGTSHQESAPAAKVEPVSQHVEVVRVDERQEKKQGPGYVDINDFLGSKQQREITPQEVKPQPHKEAVKVNTPNITYILPDVATAEQTPGTNPLMPWSPAYQSERTVLMYATQEGQPPKINLIPKEDVTVDYKDHKIAHLLNPGHDHFPAHRRDLLKADQQLDRVAAAEELEAILSGFLDDGQSGEVSVDSSNIDTAIILDDVITVPEGMSPMAALKAAVASDENIQNLPKVPVVLRYRTEHALVLSGIASNAIATINNASTLESACRAVNTTKDIIPRAQWNLINDRLTKATNIVYNIILGNKRDIITDFATDAGVLVKYVSEKKGLKQGEALDNWTQWIVQSSLGLEEVDTDNIGSHLIYSVAATNEHDHPPRTLGEKNIVAFMPMDSRDLDLASMESAATVVAFSTPKLFAALTTLFKLADDTIRNVSMIFEDGPILLAYKVTVGETVQYVVTKG